LFDAICRDLAAYTVSALLAESASGRQFAGVRRKYARSRPHFTI
jgi:hypothetical protein